MAQRATKKAKGVRPGRGKCSVITSRGVRCKRDRVVGLAVCAAHREGGLAHRAAEYARKSHKVREIPIPPVTLDSPADVRREAQRAVAILSTKLPAQQAGYQIASLLQVVLKAMELEQDLEREKRGRTYEPQPDTQEGARPGAPDPDGGDFGALPDISPASRVRGAA